jgi:hypothetical protein
MAEKKLFSMPARVFLANISQWVETNQSNFRIYPTDIHLLPPHGTTLMAYEDVLTDIGRC